ncbi:MAG: pre-16S rRNA-processing nuclease YqgF, partial [Deltaproteobacteria bacterium]|nr:pre-16S rRNA-processing nuclease YqgF [Deltaproteobacteria bacterium]
MTLDNQTFPPDVLNKKLLGIDYGTKTTGLALFTPARFPYPMPRSRLPNKNDPALIQDLLSIAQEEAVDAVVLGIPLFVDGNKSTMTRHVEAFSL